MQVVGQTTEDIIIVIVHDYHIVWDLRKCAVIKNLSMDLLIGEPGKKDNKTIIVPHLRKIRTVDINGKTVFIDYSNTKGSIRHLCKSQCKQVLFRGESMMYELPPELKGEEYLAVAPVIQSYQQWV